MTVFRSHGGPPFPTMARIIAPSLGQDWTASDGLPPSECSIEGEHSLARNANCASPSEKRAGASIDQASVMEHHIDPQRVLTSSHRGHIKPQLRLSALLDSFGAGLGSVVVACALVGCTSSGGTLVATTKQPTRSMPEPVLALPVEPATQEPFADVNPFADAALFVNPDYTAQVDDSIAQAPELAAPMQVVREQPTALWLDRIEAVAGVPARLQEAKQQSSAAGKPVVPVFVVYDLPNRDCAAKASNGELKIEEQGESRYRTEYIDVIAQHFAQDPEQRIVAIIEPDSLPNLISNLGVEKCALSQDVYMHSVAYAIATLSMPNVALYVDAAHSGWLGWEANQRRMVKLVKDVLQMAGGNDRIRGFATNVSNYNALAGDWGKQLESSNPASNELAYVDMLRGTLSEMGLGDKQIVVDTSRNGQAEIRSRWGNWCNIRGAGLGPRPTVAPREGVDAYLWIKPPGESDGIADPSAARYDENCGSSDATPGAPEAGQWFHSYFVELVRNANPAL